MRSLFLIASLLLVSYADDAVFSVDIRSGRKHYCGKELRSTLMFLCDSIYKRSSEDTKEVESPHGWLMNPSDHVYPFRPRSTALTMMPMRFQRPTRQGGVADECCSKPCTIAELSTYCGPK